MGVNESVDNEGLKQCILGAFFARLVQAPSICVVQRGLWSPLKGVRYGDAMEAVVELPMTEPAMHMYRHARKYVSLHVSHLGTGQYQASYQQCVIPSPSK